MEIATLIIAGISALAAVISAITAFNAKVEIRKLSVQVKSVQENKIGENDVKVSSKGSNSGIMSGINMGDIKNVKN